MLFEHERRCCEHEHRRHHAHHRSAGIRVLFTLGIGICGDLDYAGAGGAAGIVADRSSRFSACDNHIVELFGFIESRNGVFGNKCFLLRSSR